MPETPCEATTTGTAPPKPPSDDCPDPIPPHTAFHVAAAAAQQKATLYAADVTVIDEKFAVLGTAQGNYAEAKTAQATAYAELERRIACLAKCIEDVLGEDKRCQLKCCWDELSASTTTATAPPSDKCGQVDAVTKEDTLPKDIGELTALEGWAEACRANAIAEFDKLAQLPEQLATRIADLTTRATALEQEINGSDTDGERAFVRYLQMHQEFTELAKQWGESPATYGCMLKAAFVLLVRRHVTLIWLKVGVVRWNTQKELDTAAAQTRADNLIDLVLQCARPDKPAAPAAT